MALKKIGGTIAAIFCMTSALCGLEAFAEEWSQNLDAKPIILPCGLKFGEVYEGTVNQVRTNYLNGIASRCYEAVITNSWYGFDEIKITLTGKKRIEGVMGIRKGGLNFDEAVSNLVIQKESLARKYGIRFMGDAAPQTNGKMRSWSITGAGANDETVFLRVAEGRSEGEKGVKTFSSMAIHSRIAAKLELKDLDAEAADLSAAIKSVFGVDLEAPQSKPLWGSSWEKLPTPIEGLTERRCATGYQSSGKKIESVSFRRVFDGDVSRAELETAARRIVAALEKAYGMKLPDSRQNLSLGEKDYYGIPAAYDVAGRAGNQHFVAYGAVGTLVVSVEYAEPRYALRDGKYELVFKGGVKFSASRIGWIR